MRSRRSFSLGTALTYVSARSKKSPFKGAGSLFLLITACLNAPRVAPAPRRKAVRSWRSRQITEHLTSSEDFRGENIGEEASYPSLYPSKKRRPVEPSDR